MLSFRKTTGPFLLFSPTFGVSHPRVPQKTFVLVRPKPKFSASRVSFRGPSAFVRSKNPFFHFLSKASGKCWPALQKSPPQGLATLSRMTLFDPWKPLSASHALGLSPSKLCSAGELKRKFPFSFSVLALFHQTLPAWYRRFDDFPLTDSRAPHLLPEGLAQGGAIAFMGLYFHLSGSLSRRTVPKSISLFGFPSRPFSISLLTKRISRALRAFSVLLVRRFPLQDAGLLGVHDHFAFIVSSSFPAPRTIFSSRSSSLLAKSD